MDVLFFDDPDKEEARRRFVRRGGTRKVHKGRPSRGHMGNCACGRPDCSCCHRSDSEHRKVVDRQAGNQDATEW